jgi:glycosyltransferase involved in cell wall biosynthesis
LVKSLVSIHHQNSTLIVIIDDGSKVPLVKSDLQSNTPYSIILMRMAKNGGIVLALNSAIEMVGNNFTASFVARLDCGDICVPERFDRQIAQFRSDPELRLLGSWCIFSEESTGRSFVHKAPTDHSKILRALNFRNVFMHPTVMWRVADKKMFYPGEFPHAEDYALFYKMCYAGKAAILPLPLVVCELAKTGLSWQNRNKQLESRQKAVLKYSQYNVLKWLGVGKLKILEILPFRFILFLKMLFYRVHNQHSEKPPFVKSTHLS